MKLSEIYKRFEIPPNLQEHMLRVYFVVCFIEKHWTGENINWNLLKDEALVHDLGNIVKFDLDKYPEFMGSEKDNITHWKKIKNEIIQKYGTDDNKVTVQMLKEIGAPKELINNIWEKRFGNSIEIKKSTNWPLKILYYADLRTHPMGVTSLNKRLDDVRVRYAKIPNLNELIKACEAIEIQVQQNLDVDVSAISNKVVFIKNGLLSKLNINFA